LRQRGDRNGGEGIKGEKRNGKAEEEKGMEGWCTLFSNS